MRCRKAGRAGGWSSENSAGFAFCLSRVDLVAMKFYGHREVDWEHLAALIVTEEEMRFSRKYLQNLARDFPDRRGKIELALHVLAAWKGVK
jgi:hypothetical protein